MPQIIKCKVVGCPTPDILVPKTPGTVIADGLMLDRIMYLLEDNKSSGQRRETLKQVKKLVKDTNLQQALKESNDYLVVYCDTDHKNIVFLKDE